MLGVHPMAASWPRIGLPYRAAAPMHGCSLCHVRSLPRSHVATGCTRRQVVVLAVRRGVVSPELEQLLHLDERPLARRA